MKKVLLFLAIFCGTVTASATDFTVDGMTYTTIYDPDYPNSVIVAQNSCSGAVAIPAEVTYDGVTYRVESIGSEAFRNCTDVTSVTIPEGVKRIVSTAFQGCTGLASVTIPGSVTSIGNMAFDGCVSLNSVAIPGSVTTIGSGAFMGCTGLDSIVIPEGVKSIGELAFQGCTNLKSITFSNAMMSIESDAFEGCSKVASVTFLGVVLLNDMFAGFGTAESPVTLNLPSFWPKNDKPVSSSIPWHGGYFNCTYTDPVKDFLGTLGTPQSGNAIEVIKGDKKVVLYSPDKVNFIKVEEK